MSRKRKLNKKKLLGFILCIVLIIFFSYFVIDKLGSNKNNSDDISITSSASYTSKAIKEAIDKAFMIYEEMEAE